MRWIAISFLLFIHVSIFKRCHTFVFFKQGIKEGKIIISYMDGDIVNIDISGN